MTSFIELPTITKKLMHLCSCAASRLILIFTVADANHIVYNIIIIAAQTNSDG